jgi:hypothetical protein
MFPVVGFGMQERMPRRRRRRELVGDGREELGALRFGEVTTGRAEEIRDEIGWVP